MKQLLSGESGIATILIVIFVVLGVVVVGTVGAAAVFLSDDLEITVVNRTGTTLDIAKGTEALNLNFLPGINLPSQIAPGDTAVVQVPRRLVDSVTLGTGTVEIRAFSRTFRFGTSSIDAQRSTLDGAPLSTLAGRSIDLTKNHTLVLQGR
jgi:hypothetical protein